MSQPQSLDRYCGTFESNLPLYKTMGVDVRGNITTYLSSDDHSDYASVCSIVYTGTYKASQKLSGMLAVSKEKTVISFSNTPQKLILTIKEKKGDVLEGDYVSTSPVDAGVFKLAKQ